MNDQQLLEEAKAKLLEKFFPTKAIILAIDGLTSEVQSLGGEVKKLNEKETQINADTLNIEPPSVTVEPTPVHIAKTEIDYDKMPKEMTILNPDDIKANITVEKINTKPITDGITALKKTFESYLKLISSADTIEILRSIAESLEKPITEKTSRDADGRITKTVATYTNRQEITIIKRDSSGRITEEINEVV